MLFSQISVHFVFTFVFWRCMIASTFFGYLVDIVLINMRINTTTTKGIYAMPVVKLTLSFLKSIKPPVGRQVFYFDDSMPRFGVSVFPSGRKTFFIKYQNEYGKPRWLKIGTFPIMTLEKAREAAREELVKVDRHNDPAKEKRRKKNAKTISELCDLYLTDGVAHKKASTIASDRGRIETLIKPLIGDTPVESIAQADVIAMMNDIIKGDKIRKTEPSGKPRGVRRVAGGAGAASRTVQTLGAILTFAKTQGFIQYNPVQGIKRPKGKIRDIFFTRDELCNLGEILGMPEIQATSQNLCNIIMLFLMTGCRKSEILELDWQYIDFENQIFRFPDTKTGKQNRPFGVGALNLLQTLKNAAGNPDSGWVFPSTTGTGHTTNILRAFKQLCATRNPDTGHKILCKPDITIHSLRHTFASIGAAMGYSEIVIAALLGHHLGSVTNRYTHTVDQTLIAAANAISMEIYSALTEGWSRNKKYKG